MSMDMVTFAVLAKRIKSSITGIGSVEAVPPNKLKFTNKFDNSQFTVTLPMNMTQQQLDWIIKMFDKVVINDTTGDVEYNGIPLNNIVFDTKVNFDGNTEKLYCDISENKLYRYNGSSYVSIGGGGGDATLEHEVVCNVAAGNAPVGTVLPEGMSFTEYVERVHVATLPPSVTINTPTAMTKEVGEVITTLPIKATITKKTYTLSKAEFYDGSALLNTITGIPLNGVVTMDYARNTNDTDVNIKVVATDSNGLKGQASVAIKFSRGVFYGANTGTDFCNTNDKVRALANKKLGATTGTTFTVTANVGTQTFAIAVPSTMNVTSVKFKESLDLQMIDDMTKIENVMVEGANGYSAISYRVYQYVSAIPFSQTSHFEIQIG